MARAAVAAKPGAKKSQPTPPPPAARGRAVKSALVKQTPAPRSSTANKRPVKALTFTVDDRTAEMTHETLACRSDSHWWGVLPTTAKRRAELAELAERGLRERLALCHRCSAERRQIIDAETFDVISSSIKYPEGYLLKEKGAGRLPRREARKAFYASGA